jgi:hypothetical protein
MICIVAKKFLAGAAAIKVLSVSLTPSTNKLVRSYYAFY